MPKETGTIDLKAQKSAYDDASKMATDYITEISQDGIWVTPSDAKPSSGSAITTTSGWHISNAIELFKSGVSYIKMWVESNVAKLRLGATTSTHVVIDNDSLDIEDSSSNVVASFGASGSIIGLSGSNKIQLTSNSFVMWDKSSSPYFTIHDYGNQSEGNPYDPDKKAYIIGTHLVDTSLGRPSYIIGSYCESSGINSVSIGELCEASGNYSFNGGGQRNVASGDYSATVGGHGNVSSGAYSFSYGRQCTASGDYSHAGGRGCTASGHYSHVEGYQSVASGDSQYAFGDNLDTGGYACFVIGAYNVVPSGPGDYKRFIIGNGVTNARSNAFSVDNDGNVVASGTAKFEKYLESGTDGTEYTFTPYQKGAVVSTKAGSGSSVVIGTSANNGVSSTTNIGRLTIQDKNGTWGGIFGNEVNGSAGKVRSYIGVNNKKTDGSAVTGYFCMDANKDGTITYSVSSYANFRAAINAWGADKNGTSYWGMVNPEGSAAGWTRTTQSGIIPYASGGGSSSLGTSSYPFTNVYGQHIYSGSTELLPPDYYSASSATNVTVANTSKYRFLVILFRTNSSTYTGNGTSAATSPLNSTVVHVNNKTSGTIYASLNGNHRMSNTGVQIRSGLATITCSATAGKVALSYQQYVNLNNGSAPEVGTDTSMALVGVIGIY